MGNNSYQSLTALMVETCRIIGKLFSSEEAEACFKGRTHRARIMGNWWDVFWNRGNLNLDLILVPTGMLFLLAYHVFLALRIRNHPYSTVIGFENGNKRDWVRKMMEDMNNNTGTALSVLSCNTSAATSMISLSITLSSLIGTIVGNTASKITEQTLVQKVLYGDNSQLTESFKYSSLLLCFLIAFGLHVQSMRYFVHTTFLISTPDTTVPVNYVEDSVIRGCNYWNAGTRALFISFPLLLWIFGPIPMFLCSLIMISFLYFMDFVTRPMKPFGTRPRALKEKSPGQSPQIEMTKVSPPPLHTVAGHCTQKIGAILFGAQIAT